QFDEIILKKCRVLGTFLTFLANPEKITIKEKHWILNLTIIKEKIQLLFKFNANRKLIFICSEPKKTYEVLKEQ
ncbi:hypothetical protein, partial [Mesomycoplasma ovipneumoniae]|uniref:hypothetical protein n=1 Tax=Mesomycoplasma ovipneumoniae TaxID=29562 RepID=UPI000A82EC54